MVRGLKQQYGVRYVLCWHALAGYWSGVMPPEHGGPEYGAVVKFPRPSPGTLEVDASMRWVHPAVVGWGVPANERGLHRDLHTYLAESGVDGVKVDVQVGPWCAAVFSGLAAHIPKGGRSRFPRGWRLPLGARPAPPRPAAPSSQAPALSRRQATVAMFGWDCGGYAAISSRFHASLEDSVARHLPGNHLLNSMCCSLEDLYQLKHSNVARVGEDFYPLLEASHTAHIANAAFCTLLVGALAFPDW